MRISLCAALGAFVLMTTPPAQAQPAPPMPPMQHTNPAELPAVFAVRITTSDLARSEKFYSEGLGATIFHIRAAESMAHFPTGNVVLASGAPGATPQTGGAGGFLLQVSDLEAAIARVVPAGGTVERAPQPPGVGAPPPGGVRSAFIRDPDGVGIEVIQFPPH